MKTISAKKLTLLAILIAAWPASASSQTLYVPSGTGGIGTSSNGNVGVGTSSPGATLEVRQASPTLAVTDTGASYAQFVLRNSSSSFYFGQERSTGASMLSGSAPYAGIINMANDNPIQLGTSNVVRMTITSNGNVGIGTTSPASKFTVDGGFFELRSGNDFMIRPTGNAWDYRLRAVGTRFDIISGGDLANPKLSIEASGNVGIGTTSPGVKLDVGGVTTAMLGALSNPTTYTGFTGSLFGGIVLGAGINGNSPFVAASRNGAGGALPLSFVTADAISMLISATGNVGIGTTNPTQKLSVNGTIRAKEVIVEASPWPDDVFDESYELKALSEIEAFVHAEGHLPGVPSASSVSEQGVAVGEMQKTLLRKIEEMTLHVIQLDKSQRELTAENLRLRAEVETLKQAANR